METCKETGYRDEVVCECRYDAARDEMDREECAVHDSDSGAVCCEMHAEGHTQECGNRLLSDAEIESWLEMDRRRAPVTVPALVGFGTPRKPAGLVQIGNGLFARTRRAS